MGSLIDTSWLIAVERILAGSPELELELASSPVVSAVTIAELRMGIELADESHRQDRQRFVEAVLENVTVIPFGLAEAAAYARIAAVLRRSGQRIGERDLLIAATAVANGHSVMTLNTSEFERVPGLTVLGPPLPPRA